MIKNDRQREVTLEWVARFARNLELAEGNSDPTVHPKLRQFDIRYIILYRSLLKPNQYVEAEKLVRTVLPGASPTYSDTVITAYVVPTATTDLLPIALLNDWGALERGPLGKVRWVGPEGATMQVVNASNEPRSVTLRLKLQAFAQARTLRVRLNDRILTTQPIKAELQEVAVEMKLPPGSSAIKLDSLEAAIRLRDLDPASKDERQLTFAVLEIIIGPVQLLVADFYPR